jgi:hypothetical protein
MPYQQGSASWTRPVPLRKSQEEAKNAATRHLLATNHGASRSNAARCLLGPCSCSGGGSTAIIGVHGGYTAHGQSLLSETQNEEKTERDGSPASRSGQRFCVSLQGVWRDDPRLVPTLGDVRTTRKVGIKSSKPLLWLRYWLSADMGTCLGSRSLL